ncbi:MAG: type II toxin-antitoxin system RelE/ParE family toxin [Leptospiraceae bacterium]|nr:type II toxin-antitoxin system RelE/ParE family toxin [Leptospiraceae bacterium]
MAEKFVFREKAKQQLNDSFDWYEEQKEFLGDEFVIEVYEKLEQITERPYSNPIVFDDVRRASLYRFPFFIYYAIRDAIIQVLAIWLKRRETHPKVEKG